MENLPILAFFLFSIFVNGPDVRAECTLSKFAHDRKWWGVTYVPEGYSDIQRDFKGLETRAAKNLGKFNEGKCKVQYEGTTSCSNVCRGPPSWKGRGPGGPGGHQTWMWASRGSLQQRRGVASCDALGKVLPCRWGSWSFPSYTAPVRLHLESCVCSWASVQERYGHTGESPRRGPTRLLRSLQHFSKRKGWKSCDCSAWRRVRGWV